MLAESNLETNNDLERGLCIVPIGLNTIHTSGCDNLCQERNNGERAASEIGFGRQG